MEFTPCRTAGHGVLPHGKQNAGGTPALPSRKETARFKKFTYAEIVARDKANLDILWLKDDSLEDSDNLPAPALLAAEIVESLEAALAEFRVVEEALATTEDCPLLCGCADRPSAEQHADRLRA